MPSADDATARRPGSDPKPRRRPATAGDEVPFPPGKPGAYPAEVGHRTGEPRGAGDERVLWVTRALAVVILPFLLVAAVLLYGFPTRTGELFAWAIAPPLSAALLASAYVGGIWYFVRVAIARAWHRVQHGFPAVVVFAGALLIATLLHLDRFSENLSFAVWLVLYATTPFAVIVVGLVQRRRASRQPEVSDVVIPRAAALGLAAIGGAALLTGAVMFIAPAVVIPVWGWDLTPLTARVTGAVLSLTGVVNAALVWDRRWSAFRVLFEAQLISLAAIGVSLTLHSGDLRGDRPLAAGFVVLVAGAFVAYAALYVWGFAARNAADASRSSATEAEAPRTGP